MKRYLMVFVVAIALGVIAVAVGRNARHAVRLEPEHARMPSVALDITVVSDHEITPSFASVPKDHLVHLSVTNHGRRAVTLTLMGYQDRFAAAYVPPDSTWHGEFIADRPGEAFAWILEGAPTGRLQVTGSHLEEGRQ